MKNRRDERQLSALTDILKKKKVEVCGKFDYVPKLPKKSELRRFNQCEDIEKLRCSSRSTEDLSKIYRAKKKPIFPGIYYDASILQSSCLMRFQLISNELHNISRVHLKRCEAEASALNKRIQDVEDELEKVEERLGIATTKLEEATHLSDESDRIRKVMENRSLQDEERVGVLETALKDSQNVAEDADRKYDEVAQKLAMVEGDLEQAEERAEAGENKIMDMEEELRVVGNNLRSLEVSEEKSREKEDEYQEMIEGLTKRLKEAETRAEFAERLSQKLQKDVDRLEDEVAEEKEKYKAVCEELDQIFQELSGY